MQAEIRGRAGPPSRLGRVERSFGAWHGMRAPGVGGLRTLNGSYMGWFDIQSMPFGVPSIFSALLELIFTLKSMQSHFLADLSHEVPS